MNSLKEMIDACKLKFPDMPKEKLETMAGEQWEKIKNLKKINAELTKRGYDLEVINYGAPFAPFEPDLKKRSRKIRNTILLIADDVQRSLNDSEYTKEQAGRCHESSGAYS